MANQLRPTPLNFDSGRQSPFKRQNSQSPATNTRATTPTTSPTKTSQSFSPTKPDSLSPVKSSPFVRRPSQISHNGTERPSSPFARPTSGLSIPASPSRQASVASYTSEIEKPRAESPFRASVASYTSEMEKPRAESPIRQRSTTPSPPVEEKIEVPPSPSRPLPSPSPVDGAHDIRPTHAPPPAIQAQANLRPTTHRTITSSTTSTIRQPSFAASAAKPSSTSYTKPTLPRSTTNKNYAHIPQALLHSMRESFEVLDIPASGTLNPSTLPSALEQIDPMNASSTTSISSYFPSSGPQSLTLATYLDILSAPLADLSSNEELEAAFEAFDRDDSGQIDMAELRRAVLGTGPDGPGEEDLRMGEGEVDAILEEFGHRRAFGRNKGGFGNGGAGAEVFRWKEFMGALSGGPGVPGEGVAA